MSAPIISAWGSAPYAAALFFFLVAYFVIYPFVCYIRDPKGVLLILEGPFLTGN